MCHTESEKEGMDCNILADRKIKCTLRYPFVFVNTTKGEIMAGVSKLLEPYEWKFASSSPHLMVGVLKNVLFLVGWLLLIPIVKLVIYKADGSTCVRDLSE